MSNASSLVADPAFMDQVLGAMLWDEDEGGWVAQLPRSNVRIVVAGATQPDAGLLAHARALATDTTEFLDRVASLLKAFAVRVPEAEAEVLALQVEGVYLMWADRPADGMIYFTGPSPHRVWRCDYIGGRPQELGFDD